MSKQKKSNTKKYLVILIWCLLSLFLILIILEKTNVTHFFTKKQPNNTPTTTFDTSTPEQKQQDAETNAANKQQLADKNADQTQQNSNTSKSINLSAQTESNDTVTIFTKLYGYSNGSCDLTISNGSANIHQTAAVIYAPEYSTCAGFSIAKTTLGSGNWTIKLNLESNGTVDTKTINFMVN